MDGAILVVVSSRWSNASDKRAYTISKQVGVRYIVVFLNKADMVDDRRIIRIS